MTNRNNGRIKFNELEARRENLEVTISLLDYLKFPSIEYYNPEKSEMLD